MKHSNKKEARILWTCYVEKDGLEKGMMLACGEGRERRGQPRRRWIVIGMKLAELRDVTTERKQWRRLATMVTRVPRADSTR